MTAADVVPNSPDVTPAQEAPPAAPTALPAGSKSAELPKDLMRNPAFQGLMAGSPGALSANIKAFKNRPEAHDFVQHKDLLMKAGIAFYRALDGQTGVVFNQMYVHGDELKQADAAGQLASVAPPFDSVNHAISKSGIMHPALDSSRVPPTGFKSAPPVPVPQSASAPMAPPSAAAQRDLQGARVANMQQGSPTSGGVPGAGNLLRQVLKPVL